VGIVAVTKTHPPEAVVAALGAGIQDIGENRVQELEAKVEAVGRTEARWHLVGQLQRNKVRKAVGLADLIHSVDSLRLALRLSEEGESVGRRVECLVQVNIAGEETKSGFDPVAAFDQIGQICAMPGLRVIGLMTIAPYTSDESLLRSVFGSLRELREEAARSVARFEPIHLSMGMSNDFEIAVEEGSTLLRLGTVLFGEREK